MPLRSRSRASRSTQVLIAVLADAFQLIELAHRSRWRSRRRRAGSAAAIRRWRASSSACMLGMRARLRCQLAQQRRVDASRAALADRGRRAERVAQLRQVSRSRALQRDARQAALDIADMAQKLVQRACTRRRSISAPIACSRSSIGVAVAQRAVQPAPQLAPAHRRRRVIEHRGDRAFRPVGKADIELEIAARRCIQQHGVAALFGAQSAQMRQRGLLRVAHVLQQASGRADRRADDRRSRSRTDRASRIVRTSRRVAAFRDRNARAGVRARTR